MALASQPETATLPFIILHSEKSGSGGQSQQQQTHRGRGDNADSEKL